MDDLRVAPEVWFGDWKDNLESRGDVRLEIPRIDVILEELFALRGEHRLPSVSRGFDIPTVRSNLGMLIDHASRKGLSSMLVETMRSLAAPQNRKPTDLMFFLSDLRNYIVDDFPKDDLQALELVLSDVEQLTASCQRFLDAVPDAKIRPLVLGRTRGPVPGLVCLRYDLSNYFESSSRFVKAAHQHIRAIISALNQAGLGNDARRGHAA